MTAYYEVGSWIASAAALAFITCFRPAYLKQLFKGPMKWPAIFGLVAFLSCPLSPVPLYSLALCFKLWVIIFAMGALKSATEGEAGARALLLTSFIGTFVLLIVGLLSVLAGPGPIFAGGRMVVIGFSGTAGILLVLSAFFFQQTKSLWFLAAAAFSLTVMMVAGSKAGIAASFLSLAAFFVLLKKPGQAVMGMLGFTVVFMVFVMFTPLGSFLTRYEQSGDASTLTGRTNLWNAIWPEIVEHPIMGHGYRASRFLSAEVEGAFAEAGHTHNSFLEVLYNNGILGLVPILAICWITITRLVRVARSPLTRQTRAYAAALLGLYIHLLAWGMFSPTFGGMPDSRFMTFLLVFLCSTFLTTSKVQARDEVH